MPTNLLALQLKTWKVWQDEESPSLLRLPSLHVLARKHHGSEFEPGENVKNVMQLKNNQCTSVHIEENTRET